MDQKPREGFLRAGREEKAEVKQNEPVRPSDFAEKTEISIGGLGDKRAAEEADKALDVAHEDEDRKDEPPFMKRMRVKFEEAPDKGESKKEDEPADSEAQDEPEEARPAWVIRDPGEPTAKEIEQHRMTGHIPFRIWCPYCLAAQAKERAHFKSGPREDDDNGIPQLGLDYGVLFI